MVALDFIRVALCTPSTKIANVYANLETHKMLIDQISQTGASIVVFPELSLTGYSCNDLFHNSGLLLNVEKAILDLESYSSKYPDLLIVVGAPIPVNGQLFNCAVVINNGHIAGIVSKTYPPNYNEFKEDIYFQDALVNPLDISIGSNHNVKLSNSLIFHDISNDVSIGIEICEDLWAPWPPSIPAAISGAEIILNLSASNELIGKSAHRDELIRIMSDKIHAGYCFVSANSSESTAEVVFGGHTLIYELGEKIAEKPIFSSSPFIIADLDVGRIKSARLRNTTWKKAIRRTTTKNMTVPIRISMHNEAPLLRPMHKFPFLPYNANAKTIFDLLSGSCSSIVKNRLQETFLIQAVGLAKRAERAKAKSFVIGLSGGVDSTYAFLVSQKALEMSNVEKITAITMPGPGTSPQTLALVNELGKSFDIPIRKIPIDELIKKETSLLKHNGEIDLAYENMQARLRTEIAFNIANMENGIVVGTGDLSEIALGWMTYNGDHMSSYAVNSSIPKTMVQLLIKWYAETKASTLQKSVLLKILEIPISPELRPSENGEIAQKTEELIGPYELHDFFLYHFVVNFFSPQKIKFLAQQTFADKYSNDEIAKWLNVFLKRFFSNQFKRSAMPEGPKVTAVSLSPRSQWRVNGDVTSPKFT